MTAVLWLADRVGLWAPWTVLLALLLLTMWISAPGAG